MAAGLTARRLRELRDECGSLEAAAIAHPELAEQIQAVLAYGATVKATVQAVRREPEALDPLPPDPAIGLQRRIADELAALRRHLEAAPDGGQDDSDVHPRSNPDPYPAAVFWKAVAMLVDGKPMSTIATETNLSYPRVVKIRDWKAHPDQPGPGGSPGYKLYPGESSATLVLRKLRNPR